MSIEKITARITAELIEVYETREEALADLPKDDEREGEQFIVARNKTGFNEKDMPWAIFQIITVGQETKI